eukprot:401238-Alexandrium_andersonii.AAC.1
MHSSGCARPVQHVVVRPSVSGLGLFCPAARLPSRALLLPPGPECARPLCVSGSIGPLARP